MSSPKIQRITESVMPKPNLRDVSKVAPAKESAFERVQLARHCDRPYTLDYVERLFEGFQELHGDRRYGDDPAIVCGLARFNGTAAVVVGHQKGRDTKQRRYRNFGMAKPEGYRKALRAMKLAEKFSLPIIQFVDTPGAYPGIDAEERGQAEAIAYNLKEMIGLTVPVISVVIGEGGSGGALAIGIADRVLILENAIYSVITPEGCAAILWKDASMAKRAAENLKLTAPDLLKLGVVDIVVPEPEGGAHLDLEKMCKTLKQAIADVLANVTRLSTRDRLAARFARVRNLGQWGVGAE